MIRFSGRILATLILLLVIVGLNWVFVLFIIRDIEMDALVINYSGLLRGGIQRVVKLETSRIRADSCIRNIDAIFHNFLSYRYRISLFKTEQMDFIHYQLSMKSSWEKLKTRILDLRKNPTEEKKKNIIKASEELWDKANKTVFLAEAISRGKIKHFNFLILMILINLALILSIILLIKNLIRDRLEPLANYDSLTGIFNRSAFHIILDQQIHMARRYDNSFFLIMFDIDRFKRINDTYGHDTGDEILRSMSTLIKKNIRQSDIFSRGGGEEFFILFWEKDIKKAQNFTDKIRQIVEHHKFKKAGNITISLGLTIFRKRDTKESLLKRVDAALYEAKRKGRNIVKMKA